MKFNQSLLTGPAMTAGVIEKREVNRQPFRVNKTSVIGIEWNIRKMMDFEDRPDIEVETVTDDFDIDTGFTAGPTE